MVTSVFREEDNVYTIAAGPAICRDIHCHTGKKGEFLITGSSIPIVIRKESFSSWAILYITFGILFMALWEIRIIPRYPDE